MNVKRHLPYCAQKVSTLPAVAVTERGGIAFTISHGDRMHKPQDKSADTEIKSGRGTKAVRFPIDAAPPMDDDDGFTMVDETFGVREPSDCSDQEEEEGESSPRFQKKTLVPAEPVQLGGESSSTAPVASSPQIPLATSSDDDSCVMLKAVPGMESADRQESASKPARGGVLAMLRRGINPESADYGDKPSTLRYTASSASTPAWGRCHEDSPAASATATAAVVVEDIPSEIRPGGPLGPSAPTKKNKEINAIIPAAKNIASTSIICVPTTPSPAAATAGAAAAVASPSRGSKPTTTAATLNRGPAASGASAHKAMLVTAGAADPPEEDHARTKALTVRLVPGDCAFRTVVPRTGAESLATVAHVKREIERKLGLRQLVHLSFVVVSSVFFLLNVDA